MKSSVKKDPLILLWLIIAVFAVSVGADQIPLILPMSLEPQRKELEEAQLAAQMIIRDFAKRHGWEELSKQSFADRTEIYDKKEIFDRRLLELAGAPQDTRLPKEYSAALEKRVLLAVSPQLYAQNYPDGIEEKSFAKLLAHEIAHQLHIRILNGNEEAMGPIWFFEGFAIYAAGQFEKTSPDLNSKEIWEIVKSPNRGSYKKYATVFRHFLKKAALQELVRHAGEKDFLLWLEKIDMAKSKHNFWDTQLGQMITSEGTARNARMGAMLETGNGTLWMDNMEEWPENVDGKRVVVSGVLIKRHDLPVFVFTKEMKAGIEPIPSGIPVEEGADLHEAARRYLLQNAKWQAK